MTIARDICKHNSFCMFIIIIVIIFIIIIIIIADITYVLTKYWCFQIQSLVKMWKAKRKYNQRLEFFKDHVSNSNISQSQLPFSRTPQKSQPSLCVQEKEIVKIQAFLKANKARDDYRTLSKSTSCSTFQWLELNVFDKMVVF